MSDSDRKRKFFSGRSVEQAVVAAANYYGLEPAEVNYREVEKRHGFVRARRNVVIAVDPEAPKREKAAPPPKPEPPERAQRPERADRSERPVRAERSERPDRPEREARRERPARRREEPEEAPPAAEETEETSEKLPERQPREAASGPRGRRGGDAGPRKPRDRREERAARHTSGPWWEAQPVGGPVEAEGEEEYEEPMDLDDEDEDHDEGEEHDEGAEDAVEEQPTGRDDEPERYRFVERSEGLKLRREPSTPAEGGPAREERGRGAAGGSRGGRGRGQGGEARPRGEDRRGGEGRGRGGRRRGGGRRREEAPRDLPATPPALPPPPRSERLPRVEGELAEATQEALDLLLDFIDVEAEADFYRDGERLEVELWGPDDHVLLEDNGEILLAIEHLLPRMLRGIYGDAMPVRVDCNDFHFQREERLRDLARRTAEDVRRRGRPRTLAELDPAERRIVHVTLAEDADVETESIGDGFYKRLKVLPK